MTNQIRNDTAVAKPRTVLITGANSGIGMAAAHRFAENGHCVIMACRNMEKGKRARDRIVRTTGNDSIDLMELDLASFESIRDFARRFGKDHAALDILIHNAGYFEHGRKEYQFSDDGIERTFATNVFGPMLLTELLLDTLRGSDDARVLNASSTSLKNFFDPGREIEFDNLQGEQRSGRPYSVFRMYADSKMALILLTFRQSERYGVNGIKVNALMIPATRVSPETLGKMSGWYRPAGLIVQNLNPFSLKPEQIAECYYHITTSDEFRLVSGVVIDRKLRILELPEPGLELSPLQTAGQLLNTRILPPYAAGSDRAGRLWSLGVEIMRERNVWPDESANPPSS